MLTIFEQIVSNYTFKNFDMVYYPFPLAEIISEYEKTGKPIFDLIGTI